MGKIPTATLNRWSAIFTIIGFPLLILTVLVAMWQIRVATRIAMSQNYIALSSEFFSPNNNSLITQAISDSKPILKKNGGEFYDFQLDNYLNQFETINSALTQGFLSEKDLCDGFSYYILASGENDEIGNYIQTEYLYSSLPTLYTFVQNSKDPLCH